MIGEKDYGSVPSGWPVEPRSGEIFIAQGESASPGNPVQKTSSAESAQERVAIRQ